MHVADAQKRGDVGLVGLRGERIAEENHRVNLPHGHAPANDEVAAVRAMGDALDLPAVTIRRAGERMLAAGGALGRVELKSECPVRAGWIQIKSVSGELLALGQVKEGAGELQVLPKRVFVDAD